MLNTGHLQNKTKLYILIFTPLYIHFVHFPYFVPLQPPLIILELGILPGRFLQRNFHCSDSPSRRLTLVIAQTASSGVKTGEAGEASVSGPLKLSWTELLASWTRTVVGRERNGGVPTILRCGNWG